ncbi:uncharacterized protein PITG_10848 [Phytophthora infestans T30-4]|uniref:SAM domain-containing protein n=1 Tax=Phytophthora infestans (strain T30-4) TaxID=403677 RepID=D0NH81_PHYIT|nr:uncharacterized protein PITG_10848 [Phytophthora infestans T30-4]EEY58720.1 conserved hypothetical protein [Phytophthora infestans T30-4]|eukprot:XP_002901664.1 conserved hypothetical protein [Phytophthora infestans T30-4]
MAKEGINGVFGRPKTLRSKSAKASDRLEEDAQAMETRLRQLRVTMLEEKKKRDADLPLKHAGNRWRSAREDRGSVRQYARDVQDKKTCSSRSKLVILSPATVEQWTVPQVLEWLTAIGLIEFQIGFEFHQVTGKMLLNLSPAGYEKLGVFKLSARNRLLAEMEQIRAQRIKQNGTQAAEIIDPKLRDPQLGLEMSSPSSKLAAKTHWSHVAPLSENAVGSGDGQVPVNLADGDFDEDESHASFMKALLEWRESDSKQLTLEANSNQEEEEWVNPMFSTGTEEDHKGGGALLEGTYSEEEAQKSFQEASGCAPGERQSCWQCYRVMQLEDLVHDEQTGKSFCGSTCQRAYCEQYARFYTTSS